MITTAAAAAAAAFGDHKEIGKHDLLVVRKQQQAKEEEDDDDERLQSSEATMAVVGAAEQRQLEPITSEWEVVGEKISSPGTVLDMSQDGTTFAVYVGTAPKHIQVYRFGTDNKSISQLGSDLAPANVYQAASLSADGSIVAIGISADSNNGAILVYSYAESSDTWSLYGNVQSVMAVVNTHGYYGQRIAISADGKTVAGSAVNNEFQTGFTKVFRLADSGSWTQITTVTGEGRYYMEGWSLALSTDGSVLATSARGGTTYANVKGQVRVFQLDGSGGRTNIGQKIVGPTFFDNFGYKVSLSADGTRLAVGSNRLDTNGFTDNGRVEVYQLNSNTWSQIGQDIDGEADSDTYGQALSLSADGKTLAIGCHISDKHEQDAGQVKVYDLNESNSPPSWDQVGVDVHGASGEKIGIFVKVLGSGSKFGTFAPGGGGISNYVAVYGLTQPGPLFNLGLNVTGVDMELGQDIDFAKATNISYSYTGPMPEQDYRIGFQYAILDTSCTEIFATYDEDPPREVFFDSFDTTSQADTVVAILGVDPSNLENSTLWSHPNGDETRGILAFCGRMEIYVEGVYQTFHESVVTVTINLKEGEGFDVAAVELDRADSTGLSKTTDVGFNLQVFYCDENAQEDTSVTSATVVTQGNPIQICVKLSDGSPNGVYLQTIETMTYDASAVQSPVTPIADGTTTNSVTEAVCTQEPGVCRIRFIPVATLFVNNDTNVLEVSGLGVVAFGSDPDNRRLQSNEVVLSDFNAAVAHLQPTVLEHHSPAVGAWVGVGVAAIFFVAAVAVFLFYRCTKRTSAKSQSQTKHVKPKQRDLTDFSDSEGENSYEQVDI